MPIAEDTKQLYENYIQPRKDTMIPALAMAAEQGSFLLKGMAVEVDGKGILFCGPRGSGKTPVYEEFAERDNARPVSRKVCPIYYGEGTYLLYPALSTGDTQHGMVAEEPVPLSCIVGLSSEHGNPWITDDFPERHLDSNLMHIYRHAGLAAAKETLMLILESFPQFHFYGGRESGGGIVSPDAYANHITKELHARKILS